MSQERTVQNLLWALQEMGVSYVPSAKTFSVTLGERTVHNIDDPVRAAQARQQYLRQLEVQNGVTFPQLAEELVEHITKNLLPDLKPSRIHDWRGELRQELDRYLFEVRKVNAKH